LFYFYHIADPLNSAGIRDLNYSNRPIDSYGRPLNNRQPYASNLAAALEDFYINNRIPVYFNLEFIPLSTLPRHYLRDFLDHRHRVLRRDPNVTWEIIIRELRELE
jgi:hypothetical protein